MKLDRLRRQRTSAITNGALRLCLEIGFAPVLEFSLKIGRRADICAINEKGELLIIEVKSGLEDFKADNKWHEYIEYCDHFYFAIDNEFPKEILPNDTGIIVADSFGGAIIRRPKSNSISAQRRKSIYISLGRTAALKSNLRIT